MPTLDWIGKKAVVNHHQEVPYRLIHCDHALSAGDPDAGNLLIEGDNLVALKALLPYYAGKVKCIYIDPPYNTGNENWVYNDNVNSPDMVKWLGQVVGREAEDLSRHDKWLCMMYPRLRLLRDFLREDGTIFVSIDDNEFHHLSLLMNEIFGQRNFIINIAWQKRYSRENRGDIGDAHEYLVVFCKNYQKFQGSFKRVPLDDESAAIYRNPNDDPKGRWRVIPMTAQGFRTNQMYPIETPSGRVVHPPQGRCWSMIEPEFIKLRDAGRIVFGKKGDSAPGIIRYLSEVEGLVPWSWWPHEQVGHTDEAKKELIEIGLATSFDTPKPSRLIERILQIATDQDSLILDSFAGSGTTGQATFSVNALDQGHRRFILVEMEKKVAQEVTAERLKRATSTREGLGYRYCNLEEALFDADGGISPTVTFPDLAAHVFFSETGQPIPKKAQDGQPFLGTFQNRAVYLLWSREGASGPGSHKANILSTETLATLSSPSNRFAGERVVYADGCTVSHDRLARDNILFKQVPYRVAGN